MSVRYYVAELIPHLIVIISLVGFFILFRSWEKNRIEESGRVWESSWGSILLNMILSSMASVIPSAIIIFVYYLTLYKIL